MRAYLAHPYSMESMCKIYTSWTLLEVEAACHLTNWSGASGNLLVKFTRLCSENFVWRQRVLSTSEGDTGTLVDFRPGALWLVRAYLDSVVTSGQHGNIYV